MHRKKDVQSPSSSSQHQHHLHRHQHLSLNNNNKSSGSNDNLFSFSIFSSGGNDSFSSSSSSSSALTSPSACRASYFIFGTTAIALAVFAYLVITKFVFPLVTQYHDHNHHVQHHQNQNQNQNHDEDSSSDLQPLTINKMTLCLIVGLSCAISTAVPGLFTVSCLASGFALDFLLGSFVAIVSTLIGLTISFEAGRTLFRERASALVAARFPSAQNLSQLHPTKAVWVSWFFPVPLAIKIFFWSSCSNVSVWRFLSSAAVVAVPHIATLAFIGDRASSLGEGKAGSHEKIFFALASLSVAVVSVALSRWAKSTVQVSSSSSASSNNDGNTSIGDDQLAGSSGSVSSMMKKSDSNSLGNGVNDIHSPHSTTTTATATGSHRPEVMVVGKNNSVTIKDSES